jgi:cytochrome c-type biogenesis protein
MEFGYETLIILPIALGLLGFIEPCTIGAHLLFLNTVGEGSKPAKFRAIMVFILTRGLVTGLIGIGFVALGRWLVGVQTGLWLAFGSVYLAIGLGYLTGWHRVFTRRIKLAPERWRHAKNPMVLGVAFGMNIPACAAPLVFGLFSVTAGSASFGAGFVMMGLFGLALSVPLLVLEYAGWRNSKFLVKLQSNPLRLKYILAAVFILLGLWSIWFGLYVNPEDWSGR